VANYTVELFNDEIHDTVFNGSTHYKEVITKYQIEFKVMTQIDENDKNYERELFRTNVDFGKMMKGIQGNFFLRSFMEAYTKSVDFELKLPFEKVKSQYYFHKFF
jgi:hypothetical protein